MAGAMRGALPRIRADDAHGQRMALIDGAFRVERCRNWNLQALRERDDFRLCR